jgi:hypothetical protein
MSTEVFSEAEHTAELRPLLHEFNYPGARAQIRQASSSLMRIFRRMRGSNNDIRQDRTSDVEDLPLPTSTDDTVSTPLLVPYINVLLHSDTDHRLLRTH